MMNKKIFSLIIVHTLVGSTTVICSEKPYEERVKSVIDMCKKQSTQIIASDIIEVTIKLGQKQPYENDFFMERDREQQKNIGITPNAQGEEFFPVAKTIYTDPKDGKTKDWGSTVPRVIQRYILDKSKELFPGESISEKADKVCEQLCDHRFPSSLPAPVVQELQKNGSVVCHNEWGHVVISLKDYQPQSKSIFARFFALFTRTPDLKSMRSKIAQENSKTQNFLEKNKKDFVVPTWQE